MGNGSPIWAVATVRSEHLSTSPEQAGLAESIDDTLVLEPLSRSRLGEVIEGPARRAGLESTQDSSIVLSKRPPAGMPFHSWHTHCGSFSSAGPDGHITVASYETLGGWSARYGRRPTTCKRNSTAAASAT